MSLNAKNLIKKGQCPQQTLLNGLLQRKRSVSFFAREALADFLREPFEKWEPNWLRELLEDRISVELFSNAKGRYMYIEQFMIQLLRFRDYAIKEGWEMITHHASIEIPLAELDISLNESLTIPIDLIVRTPTNHVFLVNLSLKESPFVQTSSAKEGRNVNRSLELYLVSLACQYWSKQAGESAQPLLVFLKSKKDKSGQYLPYFNTAGNDNLVTSPFGSSATDVAYMKHKLLDLIENPSQPCQEGDHCKQCWIENVCKYQHLPSLPLQPIMEPLKKAGEVKWTAEQRNVIEAEKGVFRSNAVAGSGKTTVIANRLIRLLAKGYPPESFLMITFTEKGVQELKEKIAYWLLKEELPIEWLDAIEIATFNGFGYELIRRYYDRLGFSEEPRLMDKIERLDIVRKIADNGEMIPGLRYDYPFMRFKQAKGAYIELSEHFEVLKQYEATGSYSPEALERVTGLDSRIIQFYFQFKAYCCEKNLVDYDDQINLACELLKDKDLIKQLKYRHLVVDEVQDSNQQQLYIIQCLSQYDRFCSLLICGDDAQSIYSFRGADQRVILEFKEVFPSTIDLYLTHNFRSTRQIAEIANALNALNQFKLEKEIVAHQDGRMPQLWDGDINSVIGRVQTYLKMGIQPSQIAIIGRNRRELFEIHEALICSGIPSLPAVSELLKDNPHIQRIISLARYLKEPEQEILLCEYLQFANYEDYLQATDKAQWFKQSVAQFKFEWYSLSPTQQHRRFIKLLEELGKKYRAINHLVQHLAQHAFPQLSDVLNFVEKIELHDSDLSLMPEEGMEAVVLTTAHASKGREFEAVILLASTFKSPHSFKGEHIQEAIEEERRLLFVGVTRAKKWLDLVNFNAKVNHGFIQELWNICESKAA